MQVSVFGLGYVGCVTAACLAKQGHHVIGVDVNPDKVTTVRGGRAPLVEAGLGDLLTEVVGSGRLEATTDGADAVRRSDIALICVGTPGAGRGRQALTAIERVVQGIGAALDGRETPFTVVVRSTVLPGTIEQVVIPALREAASGFRSTLRIVSNPEFMREGAALADFREPPFVLVGSDDAEAADELRALYAGVDAPFVHTGLRTAELVKYACNAFHGLKICFANEIGDLCDVLGADAREVMQIVTQDRKLNVSAAYLRPGFAFGGSCLPKDLRALLWAGQAHGVDTPVLASILPSNQGQIHAALERVLSLGRRRVGVVGLAFKAGTDDLRESPVVSLIESLVGKGYDVRVIDRNVSLAALVGANREYIETELPHIASLMCDDADELIAHAEVLVIATTGEDAAAVLSRSPDCPLVDLTREVTGARVTAAPAASEDEACETASSPVS